MNARGQTAWIWLVLAAPALLACSGEDEGPGGGGSGIGAAASAGAAGSGSLAIGGRAGTGGASGGAGVGGAAGTAGSGGGGEAGAGQGGQEPGGQAGQEQGGQAGQEQGGQAGAGQGGGGPAGAAGSGGAGGAQPECVTEATCPLSPTCRVPTCLAGACGTAPAGKLTPCAVAQPTAFSGVCDGEGTCVECLSDTDCPVGAVCDVDACKPRPRIASSVPASGTVTQQPRGPFTLVFDRPLAATSLAAQSVDGPCTGSVQLSFDDFVSCVGVDSTIAPGSASITLSPHRAIYSRTEYRARLTAQAKDLAGVGARDDLAVTFRSAGDPTFCDGGVVISAIVLGGTSAATGTTMKSDLVVLKNRSSFPVSLNGRSIQLGQGNPSGTSPWEHINLPSNRIIPAFGYFLVETDARGTPGAGLPVGKVPDYSHPKTASTFYNIARDVARVALMEDAGDPLEKCPVTGKLDFVGFGDVSSCGEGPTPFIGSSVPPAGGAYLRDDDGCTDTDHNGDDFTFSSGANGAAGAIRDSSDSGAACMCGALDDATAALFLACKITSAPTLQGEQFLPLSTPITAEISVVGRTDTGSPPAVIVQGGFGPVDVNPEAQPGWVWRPATSAGPSAANTAPFSAPLACPDKAGTYRYGFRASLDGARWQYCDVDGASGTEAFRVESMGTLVCKPQEL